jgi:CBS domain-containing protein
MKTRDLVNHRETVVRPLDSIGSVEDSLVRERYLVVKDGGAFLGILTPSDVVSKGHNLVVDCLSEKPKVEEDEDVEEVLAMMLEKGFRVLPVVDTKGSYVGSVEMDSVLRQVWDITKQNVSIKWINVVGEAGIERSKSAFSSELFHNTRNPVQAIISAASILRSSDTSREERMLLKTIEANAVLLDTLITRLYSAHFDEVPAMRDD